MTLMPLLAQRSWDRSLHAIAHACPFLRSTGPSWGRRWDPRGLQGMRAHALRASSLLGVGRAPALGRDLLTGEQGATPCSVTGLSLEQCASSALLPSRELGVLRLVHLAGIGLVTQSSRRRVFLIDHGLGRGFSHRQTDTGSSNSLQHENATGRRTCGGKNGHEQLLINQHTLASQLSSKLIGLAGPMRYPSKLHKNLPGRRLTPVNQARHLSFTLDRHP